MASEIEPWMLPRNAVQAAVKLLWDKRSMLPENSEEIAEDVLCAALPYFGVETTPFGLCRNLEQNEQLREALREIRDRMNAEPNDDMMEDVIVIVDRAIGGFA